MKATEFYFFTYPVAGRKKPATTTYRMTIEQAAANLPPGHEPILSSREVRHCPETMEERFAMGGGALYVPFKPQQPTPQTQKEPAHPNAGMDG